MRMSRGHFEQIAKAMQKAQPDKMTDAVSGVTPEWLTWSMAVVELSKMCHASNPGFDPDRFRKACEGE